MNLYGIENRSTIDSQPIMTTSENGTLDFLFKHSELRYITCATVRGYMNVNTSTLHRYNGRYGKGVVRTTSCLYCGKRSTNYMTIEYWIKEK